MRGAKGRERRTFNLEQGYGLLETRAPKEVLDYE